MQTAYQPTNNLDLLRTLYIVKAFFNILAALFFVGYAAFGSFVFGSLWSPQNSNEFDGFPVQLQWVFIGIGLFGAVLFLVLTVLTFLAAKSIKQRKGHTFIIIVGVINCVTGLLGIALGIFTFIELSKPHIKALFSPQAGHKIGY